MTAQDHTPKTPNSPPEISAASFPALHQFLRGYLHQDWQDEYDSPAEAAQQFCEDTDGDDRHQVADEWIAFRQHTKNLSYPAIATLLSDKLGSSWHLKSPDDLEAISAVFQPFARKS